MTTSLKFCKDCKWVRDLQHGAVLAKCDSPQNVDPKKSELNLVTAERQTVKFYDYANACRAHGCGEQAKWFEPREVSQ